MNLVKKWCRWVLHWPCIVALKISPRVHECHKIWRDRQCSRVITTSYKNGIYVLFQLRLYGWCRYIHTNTEAPLSHIVESHLAALRKFATIFKGSLTKPDTPTRVVQKSPTQSVSKRAPPRVETKPPTNVVDTIIFHI